MLFFYLYNAIIPLTRQIVNYILHFIRNIGLRGDERVGETIGALPQTPLRDFIPQTPFLASRQFKYAFPNRNTKPKKKRRQLSLSPSR